MWFYKILFAFSGALAFIAAVFNFGKRSQRMDALRARHEQYVSDINKAESVKDYIESHDVRIGMRKFVRNEPQDKKPQDKE